MGMVQNRSVTNTGPERPFRCLDIDHKIKKIDQNGEYRPMVYNIDHLAALLLPLPLH